jgi:chaperonin cofactor prefoldin
MITEARERSTGMVAEAQQKKAQILEELGRERSLLEKKIDELRSFERDYRARLKNYIESQLSELDHTGIEPNQGAGEGQDGEANAEG